MVISIIAILASMLLPSLSRAKEKGKTTTCINNLRQMGVCVRLYTDDSGAKYPPAEVYDPDDQMVKSVRATLGGRSPVAKMRAAFATERVRPLYNYMRPSAVYKCPADKGQAIRPCISPPMKPSNYEMAGCSYQYNAGALDILECGGFKKTPEDPVQGMARKSEDWLPSPESYIVMHEPPARLYGCPSAPPEWYQWHYARGSSDIHDPQKAAQQFYSVVLFGDGHTAFLNFSKSLSTDPCYPYEPTKDWVWYKPINDDVIRPR